jgi:hypothetical protein
MVDFAGSVQLASRWNAAPDLVLQRMVNYPANLDANTSTSAPTMMR